MPRIWIEYCTVLIEQKLVTQTRRAFDRALRALPVTQHEKIWPLYIQWATKVGVPDTAMRVYRRYLKVEAEATEDYVEYLTSVGQLQEAALKLVDLVNDQKYVSPKGTSHHQLWTKLCELLSKHPKEITSIKTEAIVREGTAPFTNYVVNIHKLFNVHFPDYFLLFLL
jgi:pre-mRNA-splicing factor SYF1